MQEYPTTQHHGPNLIEAFHPLTNIPDVIITVLPYCLTAFFFFFTANRKCPRECDVASCAHEYSLETEMVQKALSAAS